MMWSGMNGALRGRVRTATVAFLAIGCGSGSEPVAPSPPAELAVIRLPVRVHLLSSRLPSLATTFSNAQVDELLARVNEVWSQAAVVWQLESIVREPARAEDRFEMGLRGVEPIPPDLVAAVIPVDGRLEQGWDIYLARDLGHAIGVPGIYFPSIPAVVSSEVDPAGIDDPGRVLAHELGHSLTLAHVPCTSAGNLMAPGCPAGIRTALTSEQIARARATAAAGRPAR